MGIFYFQTSSALELVQSDLSEFVDTIQHDTSVVIADSATAVNRNIKVYVRLLYVHSTIKNRVVTIIRRGFFTLYCTQITSGYDGEFRFLFFYDLF